MLADGQTGSGETFMMGTSFDINLLPEDDSIIPCSVGYLFNQINEKINNSNDTHKPSIEVVAQFMELYNEDIDLFDVTQTRMSISANNCPSSASTTDIQQKARNKIEIHEDCNGNVYVNECTSRVVTSASNVNF